VQADVFAWGALFYELLCGRIPYEGPDTETTNRKVLAAEPPSPRSFDPKIPEPLAAVAVRALRHDPEVRYRDASEVAAALAEAWGASIKAGSVPVSLFALPPVAAPREDANPKVQPEAEPRVSRTLPTDRDAEPPVAGPPAVVREQHSTARDDVATMIRTSERKEAMSSSTRRRRRERAQRARLALFAGIALMIVLLVVLLTR
jgi:serine/threonine protein kinase